MEARNDRVMENYSAFDQYQLDARKTAIYKSPIVYPALGLCGESGEVAEKIKKLIRDSDGKLTEDIRNNLLKELGDVMWYVANLAADLDIKLSDIARTNIQKLADREKRNVISGSGDNR